jgi:3-deoxy-D-manno-octulosonate 8-phosphate phosphatase (KDO 8-P phosphatase)
MITYIILDVDGTLTDSSVIYSDNGSEIKKFSIRDGIGFAAARQRNIKIVVVTGRVCDAPKRRMEELGASELIQGVINKYEFIQNYIKSNGLNPETIGYVGDDINDYYAMQLVGYVACPRDACNEVKEIADYISPVRGGKGAFRDIVEHIIGAEDWKVVTEELFGSAGI